MDKIAVFRRIRAPFTQALTFALTLALGFGGDVNEAGASAGERHCSSVYDPQASYPDLSSAEAPDISGEAGVVTYLHEDRAIVELDGCFYEANGLVDIDFAGLDFVTLLVELPEHSAGAEVYVSEDGAWVETLALSEPSFSYVLDGEHELGLEIAAPGSEAPTGPVIITRPTGTNPDPK